MTIHAECPKSTVILVGDVAPVGGHLKTGNIFDADNPTLEEIATIQDALEEINLKTRVISSVNDFLRAPPSKADGLVFPLWRGGISRSRTAVVPAVCETLGLPYIGGDAYVQTVCQDKSLSKKLAQGVGFNVPKEIVITDESNLHNLTAMEFGPARWIAKSLYGAASIGIDENSIVDNQASARALVKKLLRSGLGPVVCEEYLEGPEIWLCLVDNGANHRVSCAVGYQDSKGNCPFSNRPYTFEDKLADAPPWDLVSMTIPDASGVWQATEALLSLLGQVDIFRVDLKKVGDRYYLIELTPDIYLGMGSLFLDGFQVSGKSHSKVLDLVVEAALHRYNLSAK